MEPKTELQKNAIAESRRKELEMFQRALDIQWLNSRMEDGRMGRCLALIQREAEMEKDFQERTDHAAIVNARAAKETALAFEIAKVRQEEVCDLLRRHYLRERDPSLKELAKKLQAGYVCRDLKQQILHNEYKRLQEKVEEDHANSKLRLALYNDQEAKEHEEKQKMERKTQFCRDMQQQLVNRQMQRRCQYEESLNEKNMLDEFMRITAVEDNRKLLQKYEQRNKMRVEMETSMEAREALRQKQKAMLIIEERQIEEQKKQLSDRNTAIVEARERQVRKREEINEKIAAKILADEAARLERENIIKLLQEQEYLEKNSQDDILEREKLERVKKETKEALTEQMENKKRLEREQKVKEAAFRKETESKMALEEAKEQEKQRRSKERRRLYSEELLKQILDNSRLRKRDRDAEEARAQYVWKCDADWLDEVANERKKMVEEHVPDLIGYLQAGAIKRDDLPAVRAGLSKRDTAGSQLDAVMVSSKTPNRHPKCNAQCRILREY